jgi:hypothetical protein
VSKETCNVDNYYFSSKVNVVLSKQEEIMPSKNQIVKATATAIAGTAGTLGGGIVAGAAAGAAAASAVDKIQKSGNRSQESK